MLDSALEDDLLKKFPGFPCRYSGRSSIMLGRWRITNLAALRATDCFGSRE